jgi:outer membrane biosynthesis protein TonB
MSFLDTKHKKKSFTLTTALLSVLLLLMFYIGLTYMEPPIENGITVNFGTMEFGMGNDQPKEKVQSQKSEIQEVKEEVQEVEQAAPPEEVASEEVTEKPAEKLLTREEEEAIKIKQQQETERREAAARQAKAEQLAREKKAAEEKARLEQEAKKKKLDELMGGLNNSEGTAQGSEGDDKRPGDKGQPDGDPYATSYYGSPGSGSGTGGYGLNGRSLVSRGKEQQECNEEGRVVVQIVVDRSGKVISATPGVRGTTNNDPCLLEPARKTAFMHRWNTDSNAPSQQVGFVVVNFQLGE